LTVVSKLEIYYVRLHDALKRSLIRHEIEEGTVTSPEAWREVLKDISTIGEKSPTGKWVTAEGLVCLLVSSAQRFPLYAGAKEGVHEANFLKVEKTEN